MLLQHVHLENMPIGSIRSSARIGQVTGLVINPHNLHVDAFRCVIASGPPQLLTPDDIRDLSPKGVIINDHDNLMDPDEAVRLKPILELDFKLLGLKAYVGKKKVGNVDGFAVNNENLFIQKIYVKPSLTQLFNSARLTFDRASIKEVTKSAVYFVDSSAVREKQSVLGTENLPIAQVSSNASLTMSKE